MLPALSQVCSLNASFEDDISDYAAGACGAIELWLGKLETYLETHSVDDVGRLLGERDVVARVSSFKGACSSARETHGAHWQHFSRRLELCRQLQIETLVLAGDILGPLSSEDVDRVRVSLVQAAAEAGTQGVRLALEFQSQATLGNNLETAAALVAECGSPHLGLCFDVFHYYVGPSKFEDLAWLTPENLFHVQLSDLSGVARKLAADGDRILPGDGDFQLAPILEHFRQSGYAGYVSIELLNPHIWQIPPRQFGEIGMTALRKVLGQASMS